STANTVRMLTRLLAEQGRFGEAEQLTRVALDIYRGLGYPEGSKAYALTLKELGDRLYNQQQYKEAGEIYARLDDASKDWGARERAELVRGLDQTYLNDNTGRTEAGIELEHDPGSPALAQSSPSIVTPRPLDVTAILDQEKQDPRRSAKTRADADA